MSRRLLSGALGLVLLAGCGGGQAPADAPSASSGQVAAPAQAARVSYYAAARFAEQVSFGPTPALIADIQAKGYERWIDEQLALPLAPMSTTVAQEIYRYGNNVQVPNRIISQFDLEMMRMALTVPDQLRLRVMWSLAHFIVAGRSKGEVPGWIEWANMLYRQSLGRYGDLLREVSLNPHMAHYLDNDQNRPKSAECQHCAPNENYARELMQLFSIGVFKLNADGTPQRDARGRYIETYTQRDVEELARVLTGWEHDPNPPSRPQRNWGNWAKRMTPTTWPPMRDGGRKVVLGKEFPAGQTQAKDLDDAIALLMAHPNTAPFVSLRLIQHLVKSDPTPAYVGRVAAVFLNNGRTGAVGDLSAVVKAVLLDPEARRGDNPATANNADGKFREPYLHRMATMRGMGCQRALSRGEDWYYSVWLQPALNPESVFGFYAPTDTAPGSNLLAPEQRLINSAELTTRLGELNWNRWDPSRQVNDLALYTAAGCDAQAFADAYASSPRAFLDLLSLRYFRGAMPPTLRSTIEQLIRNPQWNVNDPTEGPMRMLAYALSTPSFGVIK
ncbi:MAG: DUF1800 family protein [Rubrivivax sp.]|nr:DUF1800 family protein [Rubrivivax sp.]